MGVAETLAVTPIETRAPVSDPIPTPADTVPVRPSPTRRASEPRGPEPDTQQEDAEPDAADDQDGDGAPRRRVLAIVGSVVAQTTVLTALLFYFGWLHAYWFFDYFGVNHSVLGLTTQDFLLRSADGLFVPVTVLAAVALCGLWTYRSLHRLLPNRIREYLGLLAGPAAAVVGVALVLVAAVAALEPLTFAAMLGLPGLCLSIGVLLLAAVSPLLRARRPESAREPTPPFVAVGEWAACFVLVSVGLFWAAGDYSAAVGTGRGGDVMASWPTTPNVAVLSEKRLSVRLPSVVETPCTGNDAAYGYRYDGLKLIQQAGDRYVFLPHDWAPGKGPALVVPRTDSLRLEFTAPGPVQGGSC